MPTPPKPEPESAQPEPEDTAEPSEEQAGAFDPRFPAEETKK